MWISSRWGPLHRRFSTTSSPSSLSSSYVSFLPVHLDVPLHRFDIFPHVCLRLSIRPDLFTLPHLTFPLSFSPVVFSLIPPALSQFCSRWRRILWEVARRTYTQRHTNRVEEIEGRNRHGPSCVWVSPEGLCHLHSQLNFSALVFLLMLVCCACVCRRLSRWIRGFGCMCEENIKFCPVWQGFYVSAWLNICAGCWAGGGLVIFSPALLDLVLILNQT